LTPREKKDPIKNSLSQKSLLAFFPAGDLQKVLTLGGAKGETLPEKNSVKGTFLEREKCLLRVRLSFEVTLSGIMKEGLGRNVGSFTFSLGKFCVT